MKKHKEKIIMLCLLAWAISLMVTIVSDFPRNLVPTDTGKRYQEALHYWSNRGLCQAASGTTSFYGTQDISHPVLAGFTLSPTEINTSTADRTVYAALTIHDDLTGFESGRIKFYGPGGYQTVKAIFGPDQLVSGDGLNGTYRVALDWPRYSAIGSWWVGDISISDTLGNTITYGRLSYTQDNGAVGIKTNPAFGSFSAVHTF